MKIHYFDDDLIKEKVNNEEKYIILNKIIDEDDYVFIDNMFYEFSSISGRNDGCVVRKCHEIDSVSSAEIEILKMMTDTYKEMPDIKLTLTKFNITKEQLYKSLSEILACVKRHGKISEKEALFLFDVFSGEKSKKLILNENLCTYEELQLAYGNFMNEMQWCYGYKKPYIEHRTKSFFDGAVELRWDVSAFLTKYNLDKNILGSVLRNILHSDRLIEAAEKKSFIELCQKYLSKTELDLNEKIQLSEICKRIILRFESEIMVIYLDIAQKLINANKTHIKDIEACARQGGYCKQQICFAMRKLGVKPNYHIRSSSYRLLHR